MVCGFSSEAAVCPRCSTVLLRGQALCPRCGKLFDGWLAVCDSCGTPLGSGPLGPADDEAVQLLASVPGISEDRARALVAKGFREFSDIVRLALPEAAVKKGLHHAIARRALLADLFPHEAHAAAAAACPVCGSPWSPGADRCAVCGSAATSDLPSSAVEERLEAMTDELVALAKDEDLRDLPADVLQELLDAFAGLDPEEVVRAEYRNQIEAWRAKGFVVAPLEELLAEDLEAFRDASVRLIRAQMLKKADGGVFRCPLCDVPLPPELEICENCGAKFV